MRWLCNRGCSAGGRHAGEATSQPSLRYRAMERCAKVLLCCLLLVSGAAVVAGGPMGLGHEAFAPSAAYAEDAQGNRVDPTQRADNSFIYDTTIASLFDQASLYDDRTVQIVGEVVGDRIEANNGTEMCWVMLTSVDEDDATSISVLLSADQANQIDRYGRYGVTGTTLQVRGAYHQACSEHEGLPDIHATNSSVMARGVDNPDSFELGDFLPGIAVVAIGLALLWGYYFARERMR